MPLGTRRPVAAIVLLAGLALSLAACAPGGEALPDPGTQAVVIGIDGADWKIIDELAAEGRMPHLSGLRERGTWGRLATLPDIALSPVIWTSVATGKPATDHGIAWFMVDRPDGTRVPVRSYNRKVKALWNILADRERQPIVVGWWATYPAEDVGRGIVVSDGLGFHGFGSTARGGEDPRKTHPPAVFDRMSALMPADEAIEHDFVSRFVDIETETYRAEMFDPARVDKRDPLNPVHLFQEYAVTAQGYTAITEDLLTHMPYDLLMVYFEQVDSFSHLFMKYAPPRLEWVDDLGYRRYRNVVREWYVYQDELLGRLLAKIDLGRTAVFVLSDHGFKSGERRIRSEQTVDIRKAHLDHETHGILIAAGPHIESGGEIEGASVMDITPTVLRYLGEPVARDMEGRVLDDLFEPAFREDYPTRWVASYEDGANDVAPTEIAEDLSAEEVAERMKALESLGYVGGSGGDDAGSAAGEPGTGAESSPEIHNNLGRSHLRRGEIDEAQAEFERALALDPNNADALLNMGAIRRAGGKVLEAEHFAKRALRVNPNSIGALAQLAEIKRDLDDLDESIRLYGEALRIDDSQPFVHLGLGDSLQRAGRYDEAVAAFTMVLQLDPDSFEAHYNLGVTRAAQQKLDEAQLEFEQALELNPRHPAAAHALNNLADLLLRRGQEDEAMERFREATERSPGHFESHFNLGSLHLSRDEIDEAIPLLEQASRIAPDSEMANAALGMAYLRKGRNDDAYKSFLLVRRLYPRNWVAPLGLALLHAGAGQPDPAREYLAEALRVGGDAARTEAGHYAVLQDYL